MPTRAQSLTALATYVTRMRQAVEQERHHDQRRAILVELLRDGFGLTVDEFVLEQNVRVDKTRGRIDLLYRSLAWEVKRDLDAERDDLLRELKLYLTTLGDSAFGIGTDGLHFDVYRLGGDEELRLIDRFDLGAPETTSETALDWFDSYVFALEAVAPTTETILARFGLESAVFLTAASELSDLWAAVANEPEAAIKRSEWERLLAVVYGTQVGTEDLWLRHSYLVMVARLLAYLAITHELPQAGEEVGALSGELFTRLGLQNLVERDFFAWPALPVVEARTRTLLRRLARHLSLFALADIDEDLLKQLYETMVDPAEREWLGEFYTPDWLADLVLERAEFMSETRALDPACGSGTFLFAAIRRLRQSGLSGADLVDTAKRNVVGLDIHPLAVAIARANYVLALRTDLREAREALHVPVYMADTLAAPEAGFGRVVKINAPAEGLGRGLPTMFELPTERDVGQTAGIGEIVELLDELSDPSLDGEQAMNGLLARLDQWRVRSQAHTWQENLRLLRSLRENHRDTIWSFVLTNAARPHEIATAPVDLVVGNPPWLTVMEMAASQYKERVKSIAREFRLVGHGGGAMGDISHIDTSTVFAVFCARHFLRPADGRVAFVLPRSVMAGARQHRTFREGRAALLYAPVAAIDLDGVEPLFRIPACVMIFDRVGEGDKPLPPWQWPTTALTGTLPRKNASRIEADASLAETDVEAVPVGRASPYLPQARQGVDIRPRALWAVEPDPRARVLDQERPHLRSDSEAVQRADARAGWRGVSLDGRIEARYLYATSLRVDPYRIGRLRLVALPIEAGRGGTVRVLTQPEILARGDTGMATWVSRAEERFRHVLIATDRRPTSTVIEYLNTQQKLAGQRPAAPRVVWGKGGTYIRAAVVPTDVAEVHGLPVRGFVVDLNQYEIVCQTEDEAHYLCAMLNSRSVNEGIRSEQTRGHFGPRDIHRRPFEFVPIPRFDPRSADHRALAALSRTAHSMAREIDFDSTRNRERYLGALGESVGEVNEIAARVLD